ncbi:MAG: TspO/MBR family protein [Planctomycetota bacterium]
MASLLIFILLVVAAAVAGAHFSPGSWYVGLSKPSWTPPSWLFGPIWSALYVCIAVSGWLVWKRSSPRVTSALVLWAAQLLLNAAWSWLFFGLHRPDLAFGEILFLLGAIMGFVLIAYRVSPLASGLFVPYGLWVLFASALNFAIWRLNN